ncbi:MAG: DPP IV N-terminal domain-containing protein, partial [Pseudomonadales bacterium]
ASPPLAGPALSQFRFAPRGEALAWLQSAADDGNRLELWLGTWTTGEDFSARRLFSGAGEGPEAPSSEAEKARRERLRLFFSGVTEFHWRADGQALRFTLNGVAYEQALDGASPERLSPEGHQVHQLTSAPGDHRFAYVHEGDLWLGTPGGAVERLTEEAADGIVVGLPDFIAAEEMHRQDAFWFSPDGTQLAFIKADETPIPETLRFDATEAGIEAIAQRYPFTGGPNAKLSLGVLSLKDRRLRWLPWSDDPEAYLARVSWAPSSDALFIQRQPRDQKTLSLLRLGLDGALELALEERSESWVNLHDDFRPLASGGALWSAERGGPRQLYYLPRLGEVEERRLTPEGSIVHRVLAVDEDAGVVLIEGP